MRRAMAGLLEQLPEELKDSPEAELLRTSARPNVYNIVHLIYRANYEGHSKDYEFCVLQWRNIGAPVTMMPDGHCGIARCWSDRPITRASLLSILLPTGASRSEARRAKAMAHAG
jgi:hypothetical protein